MKFDMAISENFASFNDEESGLMIFVDSFDNKQFEVRIGTAEKSEVAGAIEATSDEELNEKLEALYSSFKGEKR